MADGTTRPIEDVNIGDEVLATDPETGITLAKPVTQLHRNTDHELTDLTVETEDGESSVLKTTQNHPFWDGDGGEWVDAAELKAETRLATIGSGNTNPTVAAVANHLGAEEMRDLTVADTHTYYVIAGDAPVLVHNNNKKPDCGRKVYRQLSYEDRERFDNGEGLQPRGTTGSIVDHILNRPTKHISASVTQNATERFASGQGLVEVDIDKAIAGGAKFVDHNNVMQAATRSGNSRVVRDARRAEEVLFIGVIPYDAMTLVRGG
ncbi:polymorphic toxin-type HINT domain-containing protein [Polymorphospora sp. A560]